MRFAGWVQLSRDGGGNVVGEFRGTKSTTPVMRRFIQTGAGIASADTGGYFANIRDYPGTDPKIRYHFADFRILADWRQTCFERPPHACPRDGTPAKASAPPNELAHAQDRDATADPIATASETRAANPEL